MSYTQHTHTHTTEKAAQRTFAHPHRTQRIKRPRNGRERKKYEEHSNMPKLWHRSPGCRFCRHTHERVCVLRIQWGKRYDTRAAFLIVFLAFVAVVVVGFCCYWITIFVCATDCVLCVRAMWATLCVVVRLIVLPCFANPFWSFACYDPHIRNQELDFTVFEYVQHFFMSQKCAPEWCPTSLWTCFLKI